jgi:hypothetical protein
MVSTTTPMIRARVETLVPPVLSGGGRPSSEMRVRVRVKPIRLVLGQDVVAFAQTLVAQTESHPASSGGASNAGAGAGGSTTTTTTTTAPGSLVSPKPGAATATDVFLQVLSVGGIRLKIDYVPRGLDQEALMNGEYLQLLNLVRRRRVIARASCSLPLCASTSAARTHVCLPTNAVVF